MDFINAFQRMSVSELREQVINLLKDAYSDGRINVDSLERRLNDANAAKTKDELLALVADIPSPAGESGAGEPLGREDRSWSFNNGTPRGSQTLFAVMGASERRGRWQPAREINAFCLMGGIKLDFREAEFPRQGVNVNCGCLMGGVEIIVPPGINAEISGIPLMGGMENRSGSGDPGAPQVTVKGVAIMGSVEIKRREVKKPGNQNGRRKRRKYRD